MTCISSVTVLALLAFIANTHQTVLLGWGDYPQSGYERAPQWMQQVSHISKRALSIRKTAPYLCRRALNVRKRALSIGYEREPQWMQQVYFRNSALYLHKKIPYPQKSPIHPQNSPVSLHKSLTYPQKSPINRLREGAAAEAAGIPPK